MKKHYDFSRAKQGELHRPTSSLRIPIYLDEDVQKALVAREGRKPKGFSKFVSKVLRQEFGLTDR